MPRPPRSCARTALALLAAAAVSAGCASIRETHGYVAETNVLNEPIEPGKDTKATVLQRYGSPSTRGAFDDQSWYYISNNTRAFAFLTPETTNRGVIAVRFGADDTVAAVEKFGLERGRVINYSKDATPTRGRELSVLEQLLGSVGNTPLPLPNAEENLPGGRRP